MPRCLAVAALVMALVSCSAEPDRLSPTDAVRAEPRSTTTTTVAYEPRFVPGECDLERLFLPPERVDCGELVVPEDRSDPSGAQVRLPVAIVRATQVPTHSDPVIYFSGGPGYRGLDAAGSWAALPLVADRDIITFDQRGTGGSTPNLDCPEVDDAIFAAFGKADDPGVEATDVERAYMACRRRLTGDGVDLARYNTVEVANDVADLRRALGIDQWNIFGISYGTTVAMEMLRAHPDGVRSAVIDSVYPSDVQLGVATLESAERAFNLLVEQCAASTTCRAAHPDLRAELVIAADRLNKAPFELDVEIPTSDGGLRVVHGRFTGTDLVAGLFNALYSKDLIPLLPFFIGEVARGNVELLSGVAQDGIDFLVSPAEAQAASVECADRQRLVDRNQLRRAMERHFAFGAITALRPLPQICREWAVPSAEPAFNRITPTEVPTLVSGNEFDPVTPPEQSRHAAEALGEAATFVWFRGLGHGAVGDSTCPTSIFRAFVADPGAPLDTSCAAAMPSAQFGGG